MLPIRVTNLYPHIFTSFGIVCLKIFLEWSGAALQRGTGALAPPPRRGTLPPPCQGILVFFVGMTVMTYDNHRSRIRILRIFFILKILRILRIFFRLKKIRKKFVILQIIDV